MLSIRQPGFSSSRRRLQVSGGGTTIQLQAEVGTLQERVTIDQSAVATGARQTDEVSMPAPQACSAAPTGGQIIPPMKIRDVRPRYKQEWRDAHLEGEILLKATLAADGTVRGVDVISPVHAELEDEAAAAVSLWRFTPTYLNCEPIEVQMYVTVSFRLQ
jgi:TonB family protein